MSNKGGESWWVDFNGTRELDQRVNNIALPSRSLGATKGYDRKPAKR
jgi:hypothetical protein